MKKNRTIRHTFNFYKMLNPKNPTNEKDYMYLAYLVNQITSDFFTDRYNPMKLAKKLTKNYGGTDEQNKGIVLSAYSEVIKRYEKELKLILTDLYERGYFNEKTQFTYDIDLDNVDNNLDFLNFDTKLRDEMAMQVFYNLEIEKDWDTEPWIM